MHITFDPAKDVANMAKHGISLAEAVHIDWDDLQAIVDLRRQYGELRMIGFGVVHQRLYCVVFTDRGEERRIISLRKANSREVKQYVSEN